MPEAQNDFIWTVVGSPWGILAIWVMLMSLITFLVFGLDKGKAKWKEKHENTRRVPEKTLFLLAGLGGSIGAWLAMKVFHHKTLHKSFKYGIPAIFIAQVVLVVGIWVYVSFIR